MSHTLAVIVNEYLLPKQIIRPIILKHDSVVVLQYARKCRMSRDRVRIDNNLALIVPGTDQSAPDGLCRGIVYEEDHVEYFRELPSNVPVDILRAISKLHESGCEVNLTSRSLGGAEEFHDRPHPLRIPVETVVYHADAGLGIVHHLQTMLHERDIGDRLRNGLIRHSERFGDVVRNDNGRNNMLSEKSGLKYLSIVSEMCSCKLRQTLDTSHRLVFDVMVLYLQVFAGFVSVFHMDISSIQKTDSIGTEILRKLVYRVDYVLDRPHSLQVLLGDAGYNPDMRMDNLTKLLDISLVVLSKLDDRHLVLVRKSGKDIVTDPERGIVRPRR